MTTSCTIGQRLTAYTMPPNSILYSASLRGRFGAQGVVELTAHVLDTALGALGGVAATFTLFKISKLNTWSFNHFARIQYLFSRPFIMFLHARVSDPPIEDRLNERKDEFELPIYAPQYTLNILEPAFSMIQAGIETDQFFGKHIFSRVVGLTAGIIAAVTLIAEKALGLIAALMALAIGNHALLNYHAYDLLRIHEGFMIVPYFLFYGIVAPEYCYSILEIEDSF